MYDEDVEDGDVEDGDVEDGDVEDEDEDAEDGDVEDGVHGVVVVPRPRFRRWITSGWKEIRQTFNSAFVGPFNWVI